MKNIILILLIVVFSSCVTQKKCNNMFPPTESWRVETLIKDSLVYRDTTIYVDVPGKEVIVEKPVYIKSSATKAPIDISVDIDTMSIENYYYTASSWVNNSIMGMQLTPKAEMFQLQFKFTQLHKIRQTRSDKEVIRIVKVVPLFYRIVMYIFVFSNILVLLYVGLRYFFGR